MVHLTTHNCTSKIKSKAPLSCPQSRLRVAIVDDDENDRLLTRTTLAEVPGVEFADSYGSGEEALNGIHELGADVVLVDIQMPGMGGVECTRELTARMPRLKIIMTTGLLDTRWINESRKAGAIGYLTKPFSPVQFLAWLTFPSGAQPRAWAELSPADMPCGLARNSENHLSLNSRENDVADLVSKGYRDKEIAEQLQISVFVVGNLVKNIRLKLDASNRAQVASRLHSGPVRFQGP